MTGLARSEREHTGVEQPEPARTGLARAAKPALWIGIALVAFLATNLLETSSLSTLSPAPVALAAVAFVLSNRRSALASALIASLILLAVSRSVLTPDLLTTATPLAVVGLLLLACVLSWKRLVLPKSTIFVVALIVLLAIPTVLSTDMTTSAKAAGIGAMWFLVFLVAANLRGNERRLLLTVFIGVGVVSAAIAVCETLIDWQFVRDAIAGSATSDSYVLRENRLLGDWTNRAQGTFGYPIPFAAFLTIALLVTLLSDVVPRLSARILIAAVIGSAIALSGTRSAVAALAVGIAVYCVSRFFDAGTFRRSLRKLAIPLVAAAVLGVGVIALLLRSISIQDFSLLHRGSIIEAAVDLFSLPPMALLFGSGYNSAKSLFEAGVFHSEGLQVIDNAFISQVIVSGLVGLIVLLALLVFGMRNSGSAGRAVIGALIAFCFFFDIMSWHAITFLLFVALGFATPAVTTATPPSSARQLARDLVSPAYL